MHPTPHLCWGLIRHRVFVCVHAACVHRQGVEWGAGAPRHKVTAGLQFALESLRANQVMFKRSGTPVPLVSLGARDQST